MKLIFTSLSIVTLFLVQVTAVNAQKVNRCADGRIRSFARVALATAAQQKLMNKYDINFYKLDIALERTSTYVSGNTRIQARSKGAALDTFAFELHPNLTIDSIVLNGTKRTFTRQADITYVKLLPAIAQNSAVSATIYYKGTPPVGGSAAIGQGMTSDVSPSWGNRVTYSLSQPFSASEWFPCKQVLTDKADSVEVWVTTGTQNKVGSNGLLKQITPMPNGKHRYQWKSTYPIAYYLISVAVGEYIEYTINANPIGSPKTIPIVNYVYNNPGTLPNFQNDIDDTAPLLEKFSELYGLYPFYKEKYGHSMAPLSGGMEHQTMTTQGFFEFTLTAHELAHQWFGDNVTCASWRDIWLNEGFASYSEYIALENLRAGQQGAWMNNTHNSVMSSPGGSVIIPPADTMNVGRIFSSRLTYDKGAAVLHMLRFEMNNDTHFFNALKQYQTQFKDSTAKTPNFKAIAEAVSGKNLTPFFNQWIYGQGYPTFSVNWNQNGKNLILQTMQTASQAGSTPFFETDVQYRVLTNLVDTTIRVRQTQPTQFYTVRVRGTVSAIQVDPNNWLLNKTGNIVKNTGLVNAVSDELATNKLLLYPNPASDFIQFKNPGFNTKVIEVLDVAGRKIRSYKPAGPEGKFNIAGLESGVYLLKLTGEGKSASAVFRKL